MSEHRARYVFLSFPQDYGALSKKLVFLLIGFAGIKIQKAEFLLKSVKMPHFGLKNGCFWIKSMKKTAFLCNFHIAAIFRQDCAKLWKNLLELWKTRKIVCLQGFVKALACGKLWRKSCQVEICKKVFFYYMHKSEKNVKNQLEFCISEFHSAYSKNSAVRIKITRTKK